MIAEIRSQDLYNEVLARKKALTCSATHVYFAPTAW
jgi:hypothetical protein